MSSDLYWIVITGTKGSGQSTFVQTASERTAYRDRRDMSIISKDEYQVAQDSMSIWSARYLATGHEGDEIERELIDRYQNCLLVGELAVDRDIYVIMYESSSRRFDEDWEALQSELLGVVVLVDSTAPETFAEATRLIDLVCESDVPFVVAANKQDLPGAVPTEDLKLLLKVEEAPVMGCVATHREPIKKVLLQLLHSLRPAMTK